MGIKIQGTVTTIDPQSLSQASTSLPFYLRMHDRSLLKHPPCCTDPLIFTHRRMHACMQVVVAETNASPCYKKKKTQGGGLGVAFETANTQTGCRDPPLAQCQRNQKKLVETLTPVAKNTTRNSAKA